MGTDKKLRTTFNKVAELYDSVRPHYPEQLFNTIVKVAQLQEDAKLLEDILNKFKTDFESESLKMMRQKLGLYKSLSEFKTRN